MFIHQHRLRHLLRPQHYFDRNHYLSELKELFRPSWQFAATRSELKNDGDFITIEIAGTPLILRNFSGEVKAFINVCPHRHAMLTCAPSGNCEVLRCQYHGWEFNSEGRTGKIPEAKLFRPWDRENAHLSPIRISHCGDLLFVTLDDAAPSLREWMSPLYDEINEAFFAPFWRMREVWDIDTPCNWKVPTENTLESYHVATVHPTWTGGQLPAEQHSEHVLDDRYTTLRYKTSGPLDRRQCWVSRLLGGKPQSTYRHLHLHPNVAFCLTDTFNYIATCQPISETTSVIRSRMYSIHGSRRGPLKDLVRHVAWRLGRKTMRMVFNEDRHIFPAQQSGLESSNCPGVIGAREERIYQFQQYVCHKMNLTISEDNGDLGEGRSESIEAPMISVKSR